LDEIAVSFSEKGQSVHTRFNLQLKCAELHVLGGDVVARVKVHGSEGAPNEAIVDTRLPESAKELFARLLPVKVRFEALA
jgi:hypothetical protein